MKTNQVIGIVAIIIIGCLMFSTFIFKEKYENQKIQTEISQKQYNELSVSHWSLANSYQKLLNQKTYSISLSPNIDTKINSTFGSTKYLTFQYYFTMDGNKIDLKPDSVYTLTK